jgi:hypothetical protein
MPSSLFNCVKSADVAQVGKAAAAYKKMSKAVVPSACQAGEGVKDRMQKVIRGEASLKVFHYLADHVTIFKDEGNLVVGIGPTQVGEGSTAGLWDQHGTAVQRMDSVYQVAAVVGSLERQSGEAERQFHENLAKAAGL